MRVCAHVPRELSWPAAGGFAGGGRRPWAPSAPSCACWRPAGSPSPHALAATPLGLPPRRLVCVRVGCNALGAGNLADRHATLSPPTACPVHTSTLPLPARLVQVGHNALGAGQVVDQGAKCVDASLALGGWVGAAFPGTVGRWCAAVGDGGFSPILRCVAGRGAKRGGASLASGGVLGGCPSCVRMRLLQPRPAGASHRQVPPAWHTHLNTLGMAFTLVLLLLLPRPCPAGRLFELDGWKYIEPNARSGTLHLLGLLSDGGVHSR